MGCKLRRRGGFTLIEMLVSLLLTSILVAGVGRGMSATAPVVKQGLARAEADVLLSTLKDAIRLEASTARYLWLDSANSNYVSQSYGDAASFLLENGRVYVKSQLGKFPLLGEGAYGDLMVNGSIEQIYGGFTIAIYIEDKDGTRLTLGGGTTTVYPY